MNALITELFTDAASALSAAKKSPSQYNRRNAVRAMFAAVEGVTHYLKTHALLRMKRDPDLYRRAEVGLLSEESYSLDRKGEASTQKKFLRTDENFLFALRMATKGCSPPLVIERGEGGWNAFTLALKIRHRLTHPKNRADLDVTDAEFTTVRSASLWYKQTVVSALSSLSARLLARK
jgi:hypothetical protein